jgi:hypothetical protein
LKKRPQHVQAVLGGKAAKSARGSVSLVSRLDDFFEVLMDDDIVQVYKAKPKVHRKLNLACERDGHSAQLEVRET